jgi:hypothetical protein
MPKTREWVAVSVVAGRTTEWQGKKYASKIYKNGKFPFKILSVG